TTLGGQNGDFFLQFLARCGLVTCGQCVVQFMLLMSQFAQGGFQLFALPLAFTLVVIEQRIELFDHFRNFHGWSPAVLSLRCSSSWRLMAASSLLSRFRLSGPSDCGLSASINR